MQVRSCLIQTTARISLLPNTAVNVTRPNQTNLADPSVMTCTMDSLPPARGLMFLLVWLYTFRETQGCDRSAGQTLPKAQP